jgi:branched-chain amino acid transport system substrate-binding protein
MRFGNKWMAPGPYFFSAVAESTPIVILPNTIAAVSDTEIKIGNTMPYSGPLSNVGTQGRAEAAYFKMLNERGGTAYLSFSSLIIGSRDDTFR